MAAEIARLGENHNAFTVSSTDYLERPKTTSHFIKAKIEGAKSANDYPMRPVAVAPEGILRQMVSVGSGEELIWAEHSGGEV